MPIPIVVSQAKVPRTICPRLWKRGGRMQQERLEVGSIEDMHFSGLAARIGFGNRPQVWMPIPIVVCYAKDNRVIGPCCSQRGGRMEQERLEVGSIEDMHFSGLAARIGFGNRPQVWMPIPIVVCYAKDNRVIGPCCSQRGGRMEQERLEVVGSIEDMHFSGLAARIGFGNRPQIRDAIPIVVCQEEGPAPI